MLLNLAPQDGTFWIGGDLGYTNDPTEIVVFRETADEDRRRVKLVLRVHMEHVAYPHIAEVLALPPRCGLHIHAGTFADTDQAMSYASCLLKNPVRIEAVDRMWHSRRRRYLERYASPQRSLHPTDRTGEINVTAMKNHRTVEYRALAADTDFELIERLVRDAMAPCLERALRGN
jgi:hypothetical protein